MPASLSSAVPVGKSRAMEPTGSSATVAGLLILLVLTIVGVYSFGPALKTPEQQRRTLGSHEGGRNFIEAEAMAQQLDPAPAAIWYDLLYNHKVRCEPLGHGVWYAKGWMNPRPGSSTPDTVWEVYFFPDPAKPLYASVDGIQGGDLKAALQLAGEPEAGKGEDGK